MRKHLFTLFALSALLLIPNTGKANSITVGELADQETTYLPIAISNSASKGNYNNDYSLSQQLYFASELTGASTHFITGISFYYTSGPALNRKLRVWMNNTSITAFPDYATNPTPNFVSPGAKVYSSKKGETDNGVNLTSGQPYTLTFDTPFEWDGTSNIVVTVFDSTGTWNDSGTKGQTKMLKDEGVPRYLHITCNSVTWNAGFGWSMNNLTTKTAISSSDRGYANKITFYFADVEPTPPATPSTLSVSSVSKNSANLSWSSVIGATSYDLQQSTDGDNWSTLASGETGNSYNWTELSAGSTQYARIRANNAYGSSNWSDAVTVTTDAVHEHNGIEFDKWSSTEALPTSGNYYLANNIYRESATTLTGNLNLCLNGKTATLLSNIIVPNGYTLTIFDNVGGGRISGYYESAPLTPTGLITIEDGGTLILHEGVVQNLNVDPNEGYLAYAIYNKGTFRMSGNPVITAATADIFLFVGKYITLDGALTNTSHYSVNASGQTITSGWSTHMSGEKASDYFVSAKSSHGGVCVVDNEAKLVKLLALDEEGDNDGISDGEYSGTICVSMVRSLTSSQYNTFCLPFALSNEQLEEYFGSGYDLEEFASSELEDDVLTLTFNKVTDLEAGKPYLLQPSIDVVNPSFEGVTITATSPADQEEDDYISFHATYAPTDLEGGNRNLLFLGSGNELFWPASDGKIKAFRAYFEVKNISGAPKARIVKKEDAATGIESVESQKSKVESQKILRNGQLYIIRDGKTYNVLGIECK